MEKEVGYIQLGPPFLSVAKDGIQFMEENGKDENERECGQAFSGY